MAARRGGGRCEAADGHNGDIRDYAVAGSAVQQRRDSLAQYLAHESTLAKAGPAAPLTAPRARLSP
jgi:hypothetical protein